IQPGESLIVRTFEAKTVTGRAWTYSKPAADPKPLSTPWNISFLQGGPELPKPQDLSVRSSWTTLGDPELQRFAGAAHYETTFDAPRKQADEWWLDLGRVCESARVRLNGK